MTPLLFALAAFAAAVPGCGGTSPSAPKPAGLGQDFSLKPGEAALIVAGGEELRVGFEAVTSDSRCPVGVNCVWEGEARLAVWVQRGRDPKAKTSHELSTTGATREVSHEGYTLRLVSLAPQPRDGVAIKPGDYTATLSVRRK